MKNNSKITIRRLVTDKNKERSVKVEGFTLKEISEKYNQNYKRIKNRYFNLKNSKKRYIP